MPLSEALAARHHANRPWWRRAAQSIERRVPPTMRGRWALSLPAATAVALVALAGAAVGGWYLTRSQSTVVDVAGASTGEVASATQPPDDDHDHATSSSAAGATPATDPSAEPRGKPSAGAAGHDGTCRSHPRPSDTPRALTPAAPTAWNAHPVRAAPAVLLVGDSAASSTRPPRTVAKPAHVLPATAIGRWHQAPITHRYAKAMAAKRQACPPHTAMSTTPAPAGAASTGAVVVDVEGRVAHPGVETLPGGSRVYEALAAAGGALPGVDVTALDLARPVTDGEQLRVGIAGAPSPVAGLPQPSAGGAARGKRGKPVQPVNLNTATVEQLEAVPDVGPSLAQRILDWRTEHGRFESVSQLRQVRGIGERKFADMRDSVTV